MISIDCCRESLNPINIYRWIKNRLGFLRENPDYFDADGLVAFCGPQGSGKTLSAVNYIYKLMERYPNCKLVTNILLEKYPIVSFDEFVSNFDRTGTLIPELKKTMNEEELFSFLFDIYLRENRVFEFRDNDDFARYNNGDKGVIFLVDEIQLYLNSLASKNINMDVITQISQQRKQRKHIVATSQVFGRMAKPLREQFSCVILCSSYFRCLQMNRLIDRDSMDGDDSTGTNLKGTVKKKFFWFHSPDMYNRYDTYYVVERSKFVSGEEQLDIYSNSNSLEKNNNDKKGGK